MAVSDKIFTKAEVPSQFIGGEEAWRAFLRKNLKVTTPVDSGARAGKYKVVVKADGKSYEQFVHINANPAKGYTTQSVQLLYKQGMRLHGLHERLAALVDSLDKTIAIVTQTGNTNSSAKIKLAEMDAFKREIIELNRKSIFFDEFKFRRRVSDLYLTVATAIEPLSAGQEKSITLLEQEYEQFRNKFYEMIK